MTARIALSLGVGFLLAIPAAAAGPTPSATAWLQGEVQRHRQIVTEALAAYRKSGEPLHEFTCDWTEELQRAQARVNASKDNDRREALFAYLDVGFGAYGADLDPHVVALALEEIPPDSHLWSIEPYILETVALVNPSRALVTDYVAKVILSHPDSNVRTVAANRVDPERQLAPGKPIGHFAFDSLDGVEGVYSETTLRGTAYLIDFWATWCAPCVAEMSGLHAAFTEFEGRGFQVLSVSLDDRETLDKFRKEQWPMPGLNAIAAEGLDSKSLEPFRISGLPMPILVDKKGVIVAVGLPLRGPRLHKTLDELLPEKG